MRDREGRGVGVVAAGDDHGADARAATRDDVAVLGVADVPAALGGRAARLGGERDDAGVRLTDPDLVGVALHDEAAVEVVLGENPAVAAAGVRVRDDADGDPPFIGEVEQLPDPRTQLVAREHRRHLGEHLARLGGEQLASGARQIAREELADDVAWRELGRFRAPALRVLPVLQRGEPRAERALQFVDRDVDVSAAHALGESFGQEALAVRVLRGLEQHTSEVEEERFWNVPDRRRGCRLIGHVGDATDAR